MAMVNIRRGKETLRVSGNTFEHVYKKLGYRIDGKNQRINKDQGRADGLDIPISDMNKEQLQEFARVNGIDTSGAKSVSEARKIIQKVIRESKM